MSINKHLQLFYLCIIVLNLGGCSSIVSSATSTMATNLSQSIKRQNDPQIVRDAIPAYLLLLDAMVYGDEDNQSLLQSAATLNSSYASLFVDNQSRQQLLTNKALQYATQSVCILNSHACDIQHMPFEEFKSLSKTINKQNTAYYYALASSWAGWIQANSNDWNAIAQLSRVETIMQRIVEVDENYQYGGAHLYLGAIATLLPASMGGKPELARHHFEQAIALSQGNNLIAKTTYAERYCRLVFDRTCHDTMLNEVLNSHPDVEELKLINAIAKQKARQLLASADDYF